MKSRYLFVYGTLCKHAQPSKYEYIAADTRFVAQARVQGRLYVVDYYPAATDSSAGDEHVYGELYEVRRPETLFSRLDQYEGCSEYFPEPTEYKRVVRPVTLNDGSRFEAWVYLYNLPVHGLKRVHNGDFLTPQPTLKHKHA